MLFRLIAGTHADANGNIFKAPAVVEDSRDLTRMFGANRFQPVDQEDKPTKATKPVSNIKTAHASPARETPEEQAPKAAAAQSDTGLEFEQGDEGDKLGEALKVKSSLGENVSDQFPKAVEGGLLVFFNNAKKKADQRYFVTEAEMPESAAGKDEQVLKTKKAADEFVAEFLG